MEIDACIIKCGIITALVVVILTVLLIPMVSSSGTVVEASTSSTMEGLESLPSILEGSLSNQCAVDAGLPPWEELVLLADEVYR